ncbi:MAG: glycine--tRNA ligase subunit beta [Acidobacteriota bacterium]
MPDYLLEVRCHELPARRVRRLLEHVGRRFFEELMSRGIVPAEMLTGATPRRVVLAFRDLPGAEPDRDVPELGPPAAEAWGDDGAPSEALRGFAERLEVPVDEVVRQSTERGEVAAVRRRRRGRPVAEALTEMVPRLLADGARGVAGGFGADGWLLPVEGVVSLLDGEILPLRVDGVEAGDATVAHAVHAPEALEVDGWESYRQALHAAGVEVSWSARRDTVRASLAAAAAAATGAEASDLASAAEETASPTAAASVSPALLDRITGGCETPRVVTAAFDPAALELPAELLTAMLAERLDGVTVRDAAGDLVPVVLIVVDRPQAPPSSVVRGLERAVAGHLADLRFLVESDRRLALAERARHLEQLPAPDRFGTWADQARRLRSLIELACSELGWRDVLEPALEAAALLEADRTTSMVAELPTLKGIVGGLYARHEGYVEAVWQAIYDHHLPRALDDPIPRGRVGRVVEVADRLESLVGAFGLAGPTETERLRSMARGLLRIVIEGGLDLDLDLLAARAVLGYGESLERPAEAVLHDLQSFLDERLGRLLGQRGFAFDEIEAAKAVGTADLPDLVARAEALRAARASDGFRSLILAAKRMSGILEGADEPGEIEPSRFENDAEHELLAALDAAAARSAAAQAPTRYSESLDAMLELVAPLDRFFADVLVMAEDDALRRNRVALLQRCRRLFWRVGRLKDLHVDGDRGTSDVIGKAS